MERLIAEIEAIPPDPRGIPHGCPDALFHAAPINNHKIAVILAGQHMANTHRRPSSAPSMDEKQGSLF
jgi:hypothetical protein